MARLLALLIGIAVLGAPGVARASVTVGEGAEMLGYAHLVASATPAGGDLRIVEVVDGADVAVGDADVLTPWTCRTSRTFAAVAGAERSAPLTVSTPSCADRLKLVVPERVGLGDTIRTTVFDQWHLGSVEADICAVRPDTERVCDHVSLPPYQFIANGVFDARRAGQWKVTVTDGTATVTKPVLVTKRTYAKGRPTILATGDSMMLTPTTALMRALKGIARTIDDVYVGSGISRPFVVDWAKLPAKQVRAYKPDAVVVSLGMGDSRDLGTAVCCGPEYVAAYAQRVRALMQTYARGGKGAVVWLNDPFQRDRDRHAATEAVNAAVAIAAAGLDRVKVVDLAAILTPGAKYRASMTIDGKKTRIRAGDGIHMTAAGARIASRRALGALRKLGVEVR